MASTKQNESLLPIGRLSARTGLSVTAVRFYEDKGLISSTRNKGGQRRFKRSTIRRLAFIRIAQNLGFSLADIQQQLESLPDGRTPTEKDWSRLSRNFAKVIDERIDGLQLLRKKLDQCIGCGCLSLKRCALYNKGDKASSLGAGPRYLLGDSPDS